MAKALRDNEHTHDHDDERVVVERERIIHKGGAGAFAWGVLIALVLITAGIIVFAYNSGSFEQAGVEADRAAARLERQADQAAAQTGDALERAGDEADQALN